MEHHLQSFLVDQNTRLQDIFTRLSTVYWEFTTTGSEDLQSKLADLKEELAKFLSDKDNFEKIKELLNSQVGSQLEQRQLEHLYHSYLPNQQDESLLQEIIQLETIIESQFTNFRATVNGNRLSNNEIMDVLQNSTNSDERKEIYFASKQIGQEVAPTLLKLVDLRNKAAKKLGYSNYYSMALQSGDLNEQELFEVLDRLKEQTDEPFRQAKGRIDQELSEKFQITKEELMPWHYSDPFFQETPASDEIDLNKFFSDLDIVALSKKYFDGIGLETETIIQRSDLYEREGKDQHAYCTHLNGQGDVRVLCNVRNTEYWMNTMLHELGHAVYDQYIDFDLPYVLRQPAHTFTTEAVAMMFGRLSRDSNWLKEMVGVDTKSIEDLKDLLVWQEKLALLVFIRWGLVMVYFERELYKNPDQDLNSLWWSLVGELQLLNTPTGREGRADWASKIHLGTVPVYYQNYILGYLAAYQIEEAIKDSLQIPHIVNNKSVGAFLQERIFTPGAKYHWNEMLEKATGQKLTPDFAVRVFK